MATFTEVQRAAWDYRREHSTDAARAIIRSFGVRKLREIPPEKFDEAVKLFALPPAQPAPLTLIDRLRAQVWEEGEKSSFFEVPRSLNDSERSAWIEHQIDVTINGMTNVRLVEMMGYMK